MKNYSVGNDKNGYELAFGDICKFKLEVDLEEREYEGMIVYDEESFAYAFEMKDDNFPIVLMSKACLNSIEKIINVMATRLNDEYGFYRANGYGDITGFEKLQETEVNKREKELLNNVGFYEYLNEITEEQYNWIMKYKPEPYILDVYLEFSEPLDKIERDNLS